MISLLLSQEAGMSSQTSSRSSESGLTLLISPVTKSTASTPTSPGASSPSAFCGLSLDLDQLKVPSIEPPKRPKSTPFSWQEKPISGCPPAWTGSGVDKPQMISQTKDQAHLLEKLPSEDVCFSSLPTEIHELILDHLFGVRVSTANTVSFSRGWSTALRHSRRRQLSDVALISRGYRELVQGRLFKHIKVQGTRPSIDEAVLFFSNHAHLQKHTRHIEVWSPVWERRVGNTATHVILPPTTPERTTLVRVMNAHVAGFEPTSNVASAYQLASRNSSLYEIFSFIELMFPKACIVTLEGGHCKKPPMVRLFSETDGNSEKRLPRLQRIRTLILKSAWNIMRTDQDFETIMAALPNLREWHTSYAKPKSKSYLNISAVAPKLPLNIRHLNLSLESNYSREAVTPFFWRKIYPEKTHICVQLAKALPQLESFTYCGRICHRIFHDVVQLANADRRKNSTLKFLDLTVKNCCRPASVFMDGSGINDPTFIAALESLVISGINSLSYLKEVSFLRIRFIDLESPMPLLNPFFQMKDNQCTGLWSEDILVALSASRPTASYVELSENFGGIGYDKEGNIVPGEKPVRARPISMKVSSYEAFSNVIAIN